MASARWTTDQLQQAKAPGRKPGKAAQPKPPTANRLTQQVLRVINMQPGCFAFRVNNTGIYDPTKEIFRKAHTQKGISDIIAVVRGLSVFIEVKVGKDRMSEDQIRFKYETERAGGIYFECREIDPFLIFFTNLLNRTR